jgi:hypothetical protein
MCTLHEASARKSRYLEVLVLSIVKRDREREREREGEGEGNYAKLCMYMQ